jgi:hypothetical protein
MAHMIGGNKTFFHKRLHPGHEETREESDTLPSDTQIESIVINVETVVM